MSNKENKINIGLDIGVSSVGWSIIDDDYNIIDMGVRLFDDPANNGNADRRNARHLRRLYSRRKIRRKSLEQTLIKYHIVLDHNDFCKKIEKIDITKFNVNNPVELKCKALKQKVSNDELVYILFHYIHHRGYFYIKEDETDEKKQVNDNNTNKSKNRDNLYPSVELFKFYKKNGYYKNASNVNDELSFSNQQWCKEIEQLLLKQDCHDEFIKEYLGIFSKIRNFNEGPGSKKSPTPYGLYRIDPKENVIKCIGKNLWDDIIGNCSYYNDKEENKKLNYGNKDGIVFRSFKKGPISELFDLFNDISNIKFTTSPSKISVQILNQIVNDINKNFPNKLYKFTLKKIAKFYNKFYKTSNTESEICEKNISGYRTKGKNITFDFTSLDNYTIIAKYLHNNYDKLCDVKFDKHITHRYKYEGECSIDNMDLLEKCNLFFIDIAKNSSDPLSRYKWLQKTQKLIEQTDPNQNQNLAQALKGLTKTSSLSEKAMLKYICYFFKLLKSQNNDCFFDNWTTFTFNNPPYGKDYSSYKKKYPYLQSNLMDNEIVSPTVIRSFNQACQIVNKIISIYCKKNEKKSNKKIYKINNITIELPRDKNTKEEKERIKKYQKENKDINDDAKLKKIPKEWATLYKWQDGKDLYDGEKIEKIEKIHWLNDKLEVDHIIPISISSDDSLFNKVLTKQCNNRLKGKNTPYQWLSKIGKYSKYKQLVEEWWDKLDKKNQKRFQKRYDNLLYEKDPLTNINDFINRNLVDTRYASRLVLNKFQDFFKHNNDYGDVKIKVVRGSITSLCRNYLFYDKNKQIKILLPKNRNLYCHHAIDASLICFLGMNTKINSLINFWDYSIKEKNRYYIDKKTKQIIDMKTKEPINLMDLYNKGDEKIRFFGQELAKYNDKVIFKNVISQSDVSQSEENKKYEIIPAEKKVHYSRKLITRHNIQLSDLSIYSWRQNPKDKNQYQIIKKIDLLNSNIDSLNKFFKLPNPKCGNDLLINQEDGNKNIYNLLQKIFNDYSANDIKNETKEEHINPFIKYMEDEHKEICNPVPNYILLPNNQRVRKLRYIDCTYDKINEFKGIFLKEHGNKAVMTGLNSLSWRIYINNKNKPIVIPMNSHVLIYNHKLHRLDIDEKSKLKKILESYKVVNREKFVVLKYGTILVKKNNMNNIFYVCGSDTKKRSLEVKPINYSRKYYWPMKKGEFQDKQIFIPINEIFTDYDLVDNDILGKIYKHTDDKQNDQSNLQKFFNIEL